ncbi:MAG TPA: ParA family protein [Candidatus Competibacter phosphatis]|nr:ParA family protein [Candidatus Competibacter phosphatis]
MKVLAIANNKGGCGKTTTADHLSYLLSAQKIRTLMIDLDPQANLTQRYLLDVAVDDPAWPAKTIADVLGGAVEGVEMGKALFHVQTNLWLATSEFQLANVALGLLYDAVRGRTALQRALRTPAVQGQFDLVIIDTPPEAGILLVNALLAADGVLLPAEPEGDAVAGVKRVVEMVDHIRTEFDRDRPIILGAVATRVDTRTNRHKDGLEIMRKSLLAPLRSTIPERNGEARETALQEAYGHLAKMISKWAGGQYA